MNDIAGRPRTAVPVFLWGAARSGTNAITNHLELSPDVTAFNEDNPAAFDTFVLRGDAVIDGLLSAAKTPVVYFKSFTDTMNADPLMARFLGAKGIYAIREPRACIGSFIREFAEFDPAKWAGALSEAAHSECGGLIGLRARSRNSQRAVVRIAQRLVPLLSAYGPSLPNVAAAYYLFQHSLLSEMNRENDDNIRLLDYDALVQEPEVTIWQLCNWLEIRFVPAMAENWWQGRGAAGIDMTPHPEFANRCEALYRDLLASGRELSSVETPMAICRTAASNRFAAWGEAIIGLSSADCAAAPRPAAVEFSAAPAPDRAEARVSPVLETARPGHRNIQHQGRADEDAKSGSMRFGFGSRARMKLQPALVSAAIAGVSVSVAILVTETLQSVQGSTPALYAFYALIAASGWVGGSQAAWISTAFSTLASTYFFIPPIHSLRVESGELPGFLEFLVCAVIISFFTSRKDSRRSPSGLQLSKPLRRAS